MPKQILDAFTISIKKYAAGETQPASPAALAPDLPATAQPWPPVEDWLPEAVLQTFKALGGEAREVSPQAVADLGQALGEAARRLAVKPSPDAATLCAIEARGPGDIRASISRPLLPWAEGLAQDHAEVLKALKEGDFVAEEKIERLGQAMYQEVFSAEIAAAYHEARNRYAGSERGLRLCFIIHPPELAYLPWEALHDGEKLLVTQSDMPLVRRLPSGVEHSRSRFKVSGPLRILFVGGSAALSSAQPQAYEEIEGDLKELIKSGKVFIKPLDRPTLEKLEKELAKGGYHILYFSGHGEPSGIEIEQKSGDPTRILKKRVLANMLGSSIRLVFLNACNTAASDKPGLLKDVAQTLIKVAKIPAVVAMQSEVADTTVSKFANIFFNTLAAFEPVDRALAQARKAISRPVKAETIAPVMYLQVDDGTLFQPDEDVVISRKLAVEALSLRESRLDLALLLSRQAHQIYNTVEARNSLLTVLQHQPQLTTFLPGHDDKDVNSVAFSPNGLTLATGGADGKITLWDVACREERWTKQHDNDGVKSKVRCVAFTNDQTLASEASTAGPKGTMVRREVATGEPIGEYIKTFGWGSLAVSFDSHLLAFGVYFNQTRVSKGSPGITVFDWEAGQQLPQTFPTPTKSIVGCMAFSPDGRVLALSTTVSFPLEKAGVVYLFEKKDTRWQLRQPLIGHRGHVQSMAFSPNGRLLASGSQDKTIILWDVARGQLLGALTGHERSVCSVAFSPDGQTLASGSLDKTIILWDVATRRRRGERLSGHRYFVNSVAYKPSDNNVLASGGNGGTVILWNIDPPLALGERLEGHDDEVNSVEFLKLNGQTRLVSSSHSGKTFLWDVTTTRSSPSPDDNQCHNGKTFLWNVTARRQPEPLDHGVKGIRRIALSPVGKTLALCTNRGIIYLWDTVNNKRLDKRFQKVSTMVFSPDGQILAVCDQAGITLWNVVTRLPRGSLPYGPDAVKSLAFHPKGLILAVGDDQGNITLWNFTTAECRKLDALPGTPIKEAVCSLAFSPDDDGQFLAAGDDKGIIRMWGMDYRESLYEISTDHGFPITDLAFCPHSRTLASIDEGEGMVILWDAETGQQIGKPLIGHTGGGCSLAFSPDGQILASGSFDKTIILWDVDPKSWEERALARANRPLSKDERDLFIGTDL